MLAPDEMGKIKELEGLAKDLAGSPVPIVRDTAIFVLAIVHDLLSQVDPEHLEWIVDYE